MAEVDDVAGHAEPGDEHRAAAVDDVAAPWPRLSPGAAVSRSTPKGLVVSVAHLGDLVAHLVVAHGRGAHAPEAAGLADRGDEAVVRHPAHAGQHHGVLDLEDVGQSGAHARDRRQARPDPRGARCGLAAAPPPRRRPVARRCPRAGGAPTGDAVEAVVELMPRGERGAGVGAGAARNCGASGGGRRRGGSPRRASGRSCAGSTRVAPAMPDRAARALAVPRTRAEQRPTSGGRRPGAGDTRARSGRGTPPGRRARRSTIASAASTPVSSAWPMPSPVIGSVAAGGVADEQGPAARPSTTSSIRAGMGQARCGASGSASGAEHVGDVRSGEQVGPQRASCPGRATARRRAGSPKPTLARPSGSGNDQA